MPEAKSDVGYFFGKYFLMKKLAAGGMGEIYLAKQQGPAGFQKIAAAATDAATKLAAAAKAGDADEVAGRQDLGGEPSNELCGR